MIKILVPGTLKRIKCVKCGALLQYDEKEDVKEENIEKHFATNMPSGFGDNYLTILTLIIKDNGK